VTLAVIAWVAASCHSGLIGDPASAIEAPNDPNHPSDPGNPNDPNDPSPPDPAMCANAPVRAGPAPLRRLTNTEYTNAVAALLAASNAAQDFPDDPLVDGYDNAGASANITQVRAERMVDAAEKVAGQAVTALATLLPCTPASLDDACALRFIRAFGQRAYRRPLEDDEVMILKTVWDQSAPISMNPGERIELVIEAILTAPQFIFKVEVGDPSSAPGQGLVALTGFEIAARLAFFLWSSLPDDALMSSASTGKLATADGIAAEARRMLMDDRAKAGIANFTGQWFELSGLDMLEKDATAYPEWTSGLRAAVKSETERFFDDIIWTRHGSLRDILSSRDTFVNSDLARLYGVGAVSPAQGFVKVTLPEGERKGVLTQASFLASHAHGLVTSPVRRGLFIRRKFLCQDLPPPPNNVVITIPTPDATSTNRQRISRHDSDPACSGCHHMMDPVGFGFELFDAIGKHQTQEPNGLAIDARGEVIGTGEIDGPYNGAFELIDKLAGAKLVEECLVTQMFRFAQGRRDVDEDACALYRLKQSFHANNQDLLSLVVDIAQSDFFRYRPQVQ
jgi:uncharacterized protein DUF1592/uncharacterized protein DUF1588/uncharacterized protein DUF1587/uncharacterized protein DUF1595/uncharacterized protein DUF1585